MQPDTSAPQGTPRVCPACSGAAEIHPGTQGEYARCLNGHLFVIATGEVYSRFVNFDTPEPSVPGETRPECPDCGTEEEWHNLHLYRLGLEITLDELIQLLDGQTEPLHPVSWLTALQKAKRARAGTLEGCAAAPTGRRR